MAGGLIIIHIPMYLSYALEAKPFNDLKVYQYCCHGCMMSFDLRKDLCDNFQLPQMF